MTLGLWFSFVCASLLIIASPGPVVTLLTTTSIRRGKTAAFLMIPGIFLGDLTSMLLSFAGLGALLLTFPTFFNLLKIIGAFYLLYLGVRMWLEAGRLMEMPKNKTGKGQFALKGFWVTILNPKSFLFFVAFMPQFTNKNEGFLPQLVILGATFLSIGLINDITYSILANKTAVFFNKGSHQKIIYRMGAINLIVAGIFVLARLSN